MDAFLSAAIEALTLVEQGRSIRSVLQKVISQYELNDNEGSTIYYLVFEIFRRLNYIDMCIKLSTSAFSIKKLDPKLRSILRLATHWIKINNKSVEDVINLLSNCDFTSEQIDLPDVLNKISEVTERLLYANRTDNASIFSLKYYFPTWMVRRFIDQWGEKFTLQVLQSFSENLPLYVRVNTQKTTVNDIKQIFEKYGIEYLEDPHVPALFKIIHTDTPIPRLSEFINGHIVIQQKASALVPIVLDPKKGEKILDMCASPGSKTSQIANLMGDGKGIVAVDVNNARVKILKDRMKLLGIKHMKIVKADSRSLGKKYNNHFDKILLDPPCTGSGTFSSRPETKWRLKKRDLQMYTKLQGELLEAASIMVKSDGIIVYSTCSLFRDENHDIIQNFLQNHPDFELETINLDIGISSEQFGHKTIEIYPHLHETEGFFIAKLRKVSS